MKIAVYAIAKNEEKHVGRFMASVREADYVIIADTGSEDKTVELAKSLGATVDEIQVNPWRFDVARNLALDLVPDDADVCIALDMDEIMLDGWRAEVERVFNAGATRMAYKFDFGGGIVYYCKKIHKRFGYRWKHPIHEYVFPTGDEVMGQSDSILTRHLPDQTKSRGQYLPLLKMAVQEDAESYRNWFYLAREYFYHEQWDECIKCFEIYLQKPDATWELERSFAMRHIAKSYEKIGHGFNAQKWYRRAVAEDCLSREPWVDLADACVRWGFWAEGYSAALNALHIKAQHHAYTTDASCWTDRPTKLLERCAGALGLNKE